MNASVSPAAPLGRAEPPSRHWGHLDGLRAAAATYVVAFHAVLGFFGDDLGGRWRWLRRGFAFGHEAVAVFIVLSGYCLMLPVARTRGLRLRGGMGGYLRRRAFRILPPYFAALLGSLVLLMAVPALRQSSTGTMTGTLTRTIWNDTLPGLSLAPITAHVLLVHNWFPRWAYQINGPLWSVATEWQIYFCFPLLLLPLLRRWGWTAMLVAAVIVGYAPLFFVPKSAMTAIPWYLVLFALGMGAASLSVPPQNRRELAYRRIPWRWVTVVLWGGCGAFGMLGAHLWFRMKPMSDLAVGLASAALLVHAARVGPLDLPRRTILRWLASRPAVAVGRFSYSLYLTHLPVLALAFLLVRALKVPPGWSALLLLAVGVPLCYGVAYGFYFFVERHFVTAPAPQSAQVPAVAARGSRDVSSVQ